MVFWTVVIAMGFISVAATVITALCLMERKSEPPQQNRSERRLQNNDDNDNQNPVIKKDKGKKNENRPSRPDDRCMICTHVMTKETMRFMNCGHALHDVPCFEDYRLSRRDCPYCETLVLRVDLPGDNCAICDEPMEKDTMKYLKCEHAFHLNCLTTNNWNTNKKCPVCSKAI
ncbi:uncharacterized protein LOC133836562 [Drosophila sulfurigaster albostrigata]|uniref:uncharacterized protein LOC133836562 n=1 Tax=Drosophila sulfurigaster albostrigata TaxID=89887 RepID=UPI002D21874A|nr:uncharacterized protein LOC133836562 [Drosophila sulfurigaster albostrigata]